jgi:hypothetical protein
MARRRPSGARTTPAAKAFLVAVAVLARSAAQALECDPGICTGDPCTIEGTHRLEADCYLDFGSTDVTLGPTARLIATQPENRTVIFAGKLTIRGTITIIGELYLFIEGDVTTAQAPGRGVVRVRRDPSIYQSRIHIDADGDVVLGGRRVSAAGGDGVISVSGRNVTVGSRLIAEGFGELAVIDLEATDGAFASTGNLTARARTAGFTYSNVFVSAHGGGITIAGTLEATRDGYIGLYAADAGVTVDGDLRADGTSDRPNVEVSAREDIILRGRVRARGTGDANGGLVEIFSAAGSVTIEDRIDVSYGGTSSFTEAGAVFVENACTVTLRGSLVARGAPGGLNSIRYREQLDVTGGSMLGGTNRIFCRCVDPPACTGGCIADPVGLAGADVEPPAVVTPIALPGCSPSGAFLD